MCPFQPILAVVEPPPLSITQALAVAHVKLMEQITHGLNYSSVAACRQSLLHLKPTHSHFYMNLY